MDINESQDSVVSSGSGRGRNFTLAGVSGDQLSAGDWLAERLERKSALGTPDGNEEPSDPVLLQTGHTISPTKVMDVKRCLLGRLGSRQFSILLELAGDNIGDEREWELYDELEAIGNQREVVRSIKFD